MEVIKQSAKDQELNYKPPHSIEAEKAVLGAILRDPEARILVEDILEPKHFFIDIHKKIYGAIFELSKNNESPDLVTVADKLLAIRQDRDYLGPAYLVELTESCPVTQNIEFYAKIVRDKYYLRRIIFKCSDVTKSALAYDGNVQNFIEEVEKELLQISREHDRKGIIGADEVLNATITEIQKKIESSNKITGVPTGFVELDQITGGFQKSDLIILAARPGMGKTALALNCAFNAAKSGFSAVIFTLEMTKEQLMSRILSTEARVDSSRMRRGDLTEDEQDRLIEGARRVFDVRSRIGIDETPAISLMELRSRCRRYQKEFGLDLIMVDYLQLMSNSSIKKYESREREISEISMGLKALAKELNIPVLALAQLNRSPDARNDKRPKISDLRESGSMEQDADLILFVYRDDYYNPVSDANGVAEILIGKNRHGATSVIKLAFQPNFVAFQNLYKEQANLLAKSSSR